jgi:hypothetical protein
MTLRQHTCTFLPKPLWISKNVLLLRPSSETPKLCHGRTGGSSMCFKITTRDKHLHWPRLFLTSVTGNDHRAIRWVRFYLNFRVSDVSLPHHSSILSRCTLLYIMRCAIPFRNDLLKCAMFSDPQPPLIVTSSTT